MSDLRLEIRTPTGLVLGRPVESVVAEDEDGWFGIRPGRADLVAVLPPGLLVHRDAEGEGFVAIAGGILDLAGPTCRVLVGEAVCSRDLDSIAATVEEHLARRAAAGRLRRGVMDDLAREMLRRLVRQERT